MKTLLMTTGVAVLAASVSCAPLSSPVTQREQTAAVGGLTGGAGGAIIGSMAGGAVAGGLFGIPIGAVAGWYVGDQMARTERANAVRMEQNEREIERLRRENERFRQEDRQAGAGQTFTGEEREQRAATERRDFAAGPEQVREAQRKLNEMGYHAGNVDGIWGPQTQAALRNFQQTENIAASGQLDQETVDALGLEETGGADAEGTAQTNRSNAEEQPKAAE